ncbi:hypothetical protein [Micromonospora sp. NPDC047187]
MEISDRTSLDLTSYSPTDVELLRVVAEMREQATERWERLTEQPLPE